MKSAEEIGMVSIQGRDPKSRLVRDVARIKEDKVPGEYDRYNMRRLLSMTANVEGEDLGRAAAHIAGKRAGGYSRHRADESISQVEDYGDVPEHYLIW